MSKSAGKRPAQYRAIVDHALSMPGAWEDHPWGDDVAKVGKKVFLFIGVLDDGTWGFSVKLPESGDAALAMPFCEPTGYGLGQRGWVSARIAPKQKVSLDLFKAWVEESYRAVAPKKLVKELDAR